MNIGVIGVGKLGLAFALAFEQAGHHVFASSYKESYVQKLQSKKIDSKEPGITEDLSKSKNITFTCDNHLVIEQCDVIYVMVATPSLDSGDYDMNAVWNVARDIAAHPSDTHGKILIVGCTTNPGTCDNLQSFLQPTGVSVVYSPTFAAQGTVIRDIQYPHGLLIGTDDVIIADRCRVSLLSITKANVPVHVMNRKSAEIAKLAGNCGSTMLISYYNMIGQILIESNLGEDLDAAIEFLNYVKNDTMWKFGFGFGGPCYPRDNRSMVHYANTIGIDYALGTLVDQFNKKHGNFVAQYFIKANTAGLPFYFDYVSYKKGVPMFDESQQLQVCEDLLSKGHTVYINPSEFLLPEVLQILQHRFGDSVKSESIQNLAAQGIAVFEVKF